MIRQIIRIDEELCNGCGLCVSACHEGAIGLVDGKAKLLRDDYCDGLGNCLPVCPTGAITFEQREAAAFDADAVQQKMEPAAPSAPAHPHAEPLQGGCPGSRARALRTEQSAPARAAAPQQEAASSELRQWPVQIQLVPVNAPYFQNADLLIAADCAAYAHAGFHQDFMRGKITLIGCPKLDEVDYAEKLTAILTRNEIKRVTVVRMEVPCCGGLANAAITALKNCGKMIPWQVVVLGTDGEIIEA